MKVGTVNAKYPRYVNWKHRPCLHRSKSQIPRGPHALATQNTARELHVPNKRLRCPVSANMGHEHTTLGTVYLVLAMASTSLTWSLFLLRMYTRFVVIKSSAWDDYILAVAMVR